MTGTPARGTRVAVVTGASRGIGAHIVDDLLADSTDGGWIVVGLSRAGGVSDGAFGLPCDVTDAGDVSQAVTQVIEDHGRIDLLVNCAGLVEPEVPLWESDVDTWWQTIVTNVRGPYLMTRAVVPHMITGGGGRVVNLNSGAGTRERAELTAYCASKSALARITGGTALAGAPHGIHAFDLAPGVVDTDMTRSMLMHQGRTEWTAPGEVTALVRALASGELDAFSGRMVRAGSDSVERLRELAAAGLPEGARMLRLRPWGADDPVA